MDRHPELLLAERPGTSNTSCPLIFRDGLNTKSFVGYFRLLSKSMISDYGVPG
jgi:hypothetical protein